MLLLVFLLGIANFAMHKAVLSSRHPMVSELGWTRRWGKRATLVIEFAVLLAALLFAYDGWAAAVWAYAIYSAVNLLAAWLILTGRI